MEKQSKAMLAEDVVIDFIGDGGDIRDLMGAIELVIIDWEQDIAESKMAKEKAKIARLTLQIAAIRFTEALNEDCK